MVLRSHLLDEPTSKCFMPSESENPQVSSCRYRPFISKYGPRTVHTTRGFHKLPAVACICLSCTSSSSAAAWWYPDLWLHLFSVPSYFSGLMAINTCLGESISRLRQSQPSWAWLASWGRMLSYQGKHSCGWERENTWRKYSLQI